MRKLLFAVVSLMSAFTLGQVTPDDARKMLEEGNARYVSTNFKAKDFRQARSEQVKGQKPYAIILTCSDSRVPPELIFDEGPGQVFVIRVAGNVVDEVVLGSIEYAAEHLNAQLLLVLGHSACGAVKATVEGGEFGKNIGSLVERISPAVEKIKAKNSDKNLIIPLAIEENVEVQSAAALHNSHILEELRAEGKFKILGGIYSIETGEVQIFEPALKLETKSSSKQEHGKKEVEKKETEKKEKSHDKPKPHESKANGASANYDVNKDKKITNTVFTDGEHFCLQVSSWKNRSKAESVANKYRKLYDGVFIMPFIDAVSHKTWYRVRIGYFTTQKEAEDFAASIE
ncbi:MAG: SPOR domain-containing protein [Ignavibacteriales bacterium]|nr:SPOR domain-containing protein [Ignavibacteriales bacterium]